MSQRNQRWLAASALAALLLAIPAPAPAAGLWSPAAEAPRLLARAWGWWQNVRILPRPAVVWEKQGSAIDPDGAPRPESAPPAAALAPTPPEGPDGAQ